MAKETRLDENAFIYQKDEHKSEREKWQELNGKQKWQYFKDYYFKALLAGILIITLIGYFVYTMFFKPQKETVFNAAVVYDMFPDDAQTNMIEEFSDFLSVDTKRQEVIIDDNYYKGDDMGMATTQRLVTYIVAGQIDVIVTNEEEFSRLAKGGNFVDLTEQFPTELYSYFEDSLYWETQEEDTRKHPYGISLKNCSKYKQLNGSIENPILGIVVNSKNKENANQFLKYLFDIK